MNEIHKRIFNTCPKTGKIIGLKTPKCLYRILFPLTGLAALIWILIRVIPKPSRLQYPCMRAAAPVASGFLLYVGGLLAAVFSFRKALHYLKNSRYLLAALIILTGLIISTSTVLKSTHDPYALEITGDSLFVPTDPPNTPMGTGQGIFPGRVVWMYDSTAAKWNGKTGYWWEDKNNSQAAVDSMLSGSLHSLTGKASDSEAWDALFRYFNNKHGKGNTGYKAGEKIVVKINLNLSTDTGNPGNTSFTSPHVILSLLRQLVYKAGVKDSDITFYDMIRFVPDPVYTKCKTSFPKVHFVGWTKKSGRELYVRDTTRIYWSEPLTMEKDNSVSAKGGNPVYLPTAVTHAAYMINLASFKAHRYGGVTFGAKNHFGTLSVDDDAGNPYIWAPHAAGVHPYMCVHDFIIEGSTAWSYYGRHMGTYNALVDLMGHKDLGGKTLLFMIDALYGVQSEQDAVSLNSRWLSAPFNKRWTSSLFLSQDDVALESVGLDFFRTEQSINKYYTYTYGTVDNYLHEAAQADNPPSGTIYKPSGDGKRLQSLGVHEHWNNAKDKKYTRDLGTGNGIELVSLKNTVTSVKEHLSTPEFTLRQNYPNPFNPSTVISYQIPVGTRHGVFVQLKIYDILGNEVVQLVNKEQTAGEYVIKFSPSEYGLSSGVYFYELKAGGFSKSRKMVYLK